ncbi:MAG: hypothetical protein ACREKE_02330 [bacterium]
MSEALGTLREKFQSPKHRGSVQAAAFSAPGQEALQESAISHSLVKGLLERLDRW